MRNLGNRIDMVMDGAMRFAGEDPHVTALLSAGQLASGATNLYTLYDWFTGDTNALNSGEIPLNLLIAALPWATGVAGLATGAAMAPGVREVLDYENAINRDTDVLDQATKAGLKNKSKVAQHLNEQRAPAEKALLEAASKLRPVEAPQSAEGARELLRRSAARRGLYGAGAGAALGVVPAVMMMMDKPAESNGM